METKRTRPVTLKPVTALDTEMQLKIRELRNEESVRKWMYRDHIISVNEHLQWIDRLRTDDRQIVFAALDDKDTTLLGQTGINDIDRAHKKAEITIYMRENLIGVAPAAQIAVIDFAFDRLGLEKLYCETIEGNNVVVNSLQKLLFHLEGFRRSHIKKDGKRLGVHLLGLTRQDWEAGGQKMRARYRRLLERYPVSIEWNNEEDTEPSIIDLIQEARSRNNVNWMNVLRLAMDKSPQATKGLVQEIYKTDKEINELTGKVILD